MLRIFTYPVLFILTILITFSFNLSAQDNDQKKVEKVLDESLQDLLNVGMVSASRKKQSLQDAPAIAYVVNEEMIRQRGYMNLLELLEDIPEVEIQYNANAQVRNMVTFRGIAGNEKILLMMNGIRVTPSTGDYYIIGSNFILSDVSRVEIIIGPASALYGVDAFAGIINIITKNQEGFNHKGISFTTSGGNFGTTNNNLTVGAKLDRLIVTGSFNSYYSAEPKYYKYYDLTYDFYNNSFQPYGYVVETPYFGNILTTDFFQSRAGASFSGNALSRDFKMPTAAGYFHLNANYEKFTVGYITNVERHSSAYSLDPKYTAFERDQFFRQSQHVLYAKHTYTSFNNKWSLQSTLTHNFYQIDPKSNFIGSSSRWQRGYVYGNGQGTKIEEQLSYEVNQRSSVVAGISFEYLNALPTTGLSPTPIDKDIPITTQNIYFIGAAGYDLNATDDNAGKYDSLRVLTQDVFPVLYKNTGAYLQWQRQGKKVDITLGGRYDHNTRFGSTVNPRLGLVWTVSRKIKAKFLAGSAYLAPSPQKAYTQSGSFYSYEKDSTTGVTTFYADYFRIANDKLKPEKLFSLETNWSYFITNNISFSVNGFYTNVTNLINFYGNSPLKQVEKDGTIIQAKKIETSTNEGTLDIAGFVPKINVLFRLGKTQWNTWISYAYIGGNYFVDADSNGTNDVFGEIPFATRSMAKAGVDFKARRWGLSVRMVSRGYSFSNQKLIYGSNDKYDTYYSSNFILLNANAYFELKTKGNTLISTFVRGRNILNNLYYNAAYGSDDSNGIAPQDPTRVMVGLKFTWK